MVRLRIWRLEKLYVIPLLVQILITCLLNQNHKKHNGKEVITMKLTYQVDTKSMEKHSLSFLQAAFSYRTLSVNKKLKWEETTITNHLVLPNVPYPIAWRRILKLKKAILFISILLTYTTYMPSYRNMRYMLNKTTKKVQVPTLCSHKFASLVKSLS